MAKSTNVSAPPAPTPPHDAAPVNETSNGDVMGVVTGEGTPEGTAARDETAAATGVGDPNTVQPEIGGEPIKDSENEDAQFNDAPDVPLMAEEAFETLKDEPFDPATNLGDWDGDGKAGGSAPAIPEEKPAAEKTKAELGTEIAIAHAGYVKNANSEKPSHDQIKKLVDEHSEGKLPNGKPLDDEFWTAYDQAYEREEQQLVADGLSDEDRLRRLEKTAGLLSPRA